MSPDRWKTIDELFHQAQAVEPAQRERWLDDASDGDREIRRAVVALLDADASAGPFLKTPVGDASAMESFGASVIESPARRDAARRADQDAEDLSGRRVGAYVLRRRIGAGGMGAVYLAERDDQAFRMQVAVKVLKRGLDTDDLLARFRSERQVLAGLEHPNIARLIDGGATEDGRPYFVMEYVRGKPLDAYCESRDCSIVQRLELFRVVCDAVQYANQKLVVHRDLKPGNILVTDQGVPKLLDFGIAKVLRPVQHADTITARGERLLSPRYASPEQVRGEPVTTACDVYSLGVVLYELLTGMPPYEADSPSREAIEHAVCETEPIKPSAAVLVSANGSGSEARRIGRRLRGDLDTIILMALHKEPQRRYRSVEQFSEDIRRHLEGLPLIARPDSFAYRASKFVRRNRIPVATAALIVLVLIGAMIGISWQAAKAAQQRDIARAVNDFLNDDLLAAVHPAQMGADVTVRQVLDAAAQRIEARFDGQPLVEAEIRETVGMTYSGIDRHADALPHLQRAVELRERHQGANDPTTLRARHKLAHALTMLRRFDEAERLYREVLTAQTRLLGGTHSHTLATQNGLAMLLRLQPGRVDEAEALFRGVLDADELATPEGERTRLVAMHELGTILLRSERAAEAEPMLRQAMEHCLRTFGPDHARTVSAQQAYGRALAVLERFEEAEPLLQDAYQHTRQMHGPTHLNTVISLYELCHVLWRLDRFAEAEALLIEAYDSYMDAAGQPDVSTAVIAKQLVAIYESWHAADPGAGYDAKAERWRAHITHGPH